MSAPRPPPRPRDRPGRGRGATTAPPAQLRGSLELAEEPLVPLVEQADVRDAVQRDRHPLDAYPEREPRIALGVVAHVLQDVRMDHPRTQQLDPAFTLAR